MAIKVHPVPVSLEVAQLNIINAVFSLYNRHLPIFLMCGRVETSRFAVLLRDSLTRSFTLWYVTSIVLCVILEEVVRPISSNAPRPHRVLIGHVRCDAGGRSAAESGDEQDRRQLGAASRSNQNSTAQWLDLQRSETRREPRLQVL